MADERKGLYIPRVVLEDENLGQTVKMVYAVMIEGMDEDNICRLSSQDIADRLYITKVSANNSRLKLCDLGYVLLISGTKNNYKLVKIKRKRKESKDE